MRFPPALTPGQDSALRLDTAMRAAKELTDKDIAILKEGAAHRDGVIKPKKWSNFDRPEKRMAKLVALGCAFGIAHGDWYITPTGRLAITT